MAYSSLAAQPSASPGALASEPPRWPPRRNDGPSERSERPTLKVGPARERRLLPRRAYVGEVSLLVEGRWIRGSTCDISTGGLSLVAPTTPSPGQRVFARVVLPTCGRCDLESEVRWSVEASPAVAAAHGPGVRRIGLRFVRVPGAALGALARLGAGADGCPPGAGPR